MRIQCLPHDSPCYAVVNFIRPLFHFTFSCVTTNVIRLTMFAACPFIHSFFAFATADIGQRMLSVCLPGWVHSIAWPAPVQRGAPFRLHGPRAQTVMAQWLAMQTGSEHCSVVAAAPDQLTRPRTELQRQCGNDTTWRMTLRGVSMERDMAKRE